jgi:predicted phosphodiesterase
MKLVFISDLHLCWHREPVMFINSLEDGDVLCISGDIEPKDWKQVFEAFSKKYKHVVFVAGNHDYYDSNRSKVNNRFVRLQHYFPNIHWLNNSSVTIEGQRFVGTTLWWNKPSSPVLQLYCRTSLRDFTKIEGYNKWHSEACDKSRKYLSEAIKETDIVLTHHCPREELFLECDTMIKPCYITDMSFLKVKPKIWAFGHTHKNVQETIDNTLYINGGFGYYGEYDYCNSNMRGITVSI